MGTPASRRLTLRCAPSGRTAARGISAAARAKRDVFRTLVRSKTITWAVASLSGPRLLPLRLVIWSRTSRLLPERV